MWRLPLLGLLCLASTAAGKSNTLKPGTFYKYDQLGVRKTEINGNRIDLVFKPQDEQFHWCPGIKVQSTEKATIVTFVRCKTSQSCGVDKKAAIGKRLIRTVSIDSNGLDVYVRNGEKKFKRIFKSPHSKAKPKTTTKSTSKTKAAKGNRRAVVLKPVEDHVLRGQVKNYLIEPVQ